MQKFLSLSIALGILFAAAQPVQARDTKHLISIEEGLNTKDAESKLDGSVKFYFAGQQHPAVLEKLSTDVSNRKTNAVGKTDEVACQWAFLSALVAFEQNAKKLGANAVVNIVSYYKKDEMASTTQFECHAGAIMAGVALKGDFVKISNK
ncbi:excinuclease ATPase subunit [Herbaspirillum chlorophenolicum]|uniref:Excinuclease ATPase subunit n=1 Tax=Herbaspirillum chlorophenolicum TaxID=211589 RepID=A0ABW8EVN7_9BURK